MKKLLSAMFLGLFMAAAMPVMAEEAAAGGATMAPAKDGASADAPKSGAHKKKGKKRSHKAARKHKGKKSHKGASAGSGQAQPSDSAK